jgi:hypothetical protein
MSIKKLIAALALLCLPVGVYAQGLPLKDGSASTLATVAACGTPNCLAVVTPTAPASTGLGGLVGSTGAPASSATTGRNNRNYVAEDHGIQVASKYLYWDDTFNATTQNTSKYQFANTTQTVTQAAGTLNLNAAAGNAANTNSGLKTFRTFPIFGKSETRVNISGYLTQTPQANNLVEFGLIACDLTTRVAPTDGVFWRYNAAAELRGVINYAGTETTTAAITPPSINVIHDFLIVIQTNTVLFYIDDVLQATVTLLTDIPGQGQPLSAAEANLTFRTYINAATPAVATVVKISDVFVTSLGVDQQKPWSEQKAGFGHMAYQGQDGGTMGTTANTLNGATPAAAALTNTAISTGSPVGLGGLAHVLPTLVVGTDGILFSFQNPAGGTTQTPRNLVIRGVTIAGGVDLVLSAGALLVYAYSLAYGHTAISMATAEGTSFGTSPTTKAPRRIWLGVHNTLAAAVAGTALGPGPISVQFTAPVVVAPGEFVAIVVRNQGVVTATGSVIITAAFDAYFE